VSASNWQVIFHADRGTQFTSAQVANAAGDLGVLRSMGRTGVCWDNAAAETFWSTLKAELCNRRRWHTKAEARLAVGAWIEDRYNRRRRHSSIGMLSPVRYELTRSDGNHRLTACPPFGGEAQNFQFGLFVDFPGGLCQLPAIGRLRCAQSEGRLDV
jgi:hypothetical protein